MGAIIVLVLFVGIIFLRGKINKTVYRAKQTVLNKAGIGDSNIDAMADGILDQGKMKKFLENHPAYTEESIKELIKEICIEVANRNLTHRADSKVTEKLATDSKITKYANMDVKRCNVTAYNEKAGLFIAKAILSDGKDEYWMFLTFQLSGDELTLTKYQMQKGAVVGF